MVTNLADGGKRFGYTVDTIFESCIMRSSTTINGLYGADPDKKRFFISNDTRELFDSSIMYVKDLVFYPISIMAKDRESACVYRKGIDLNPIGPNPIIPAPILGFEAPAIPDAPAKDTIYYLIDVPVNWSENLTSLIDNTLFDMLVLKSLHKLYQNLGHIDLGEMFKAHYEDSYSYLRSVISYRTKPVRVTYRGL